MLGEEFDLGVLPGHCKKILMSYGAMKKGGWFPEYLNKSRFLTLVSRLALRKTSYYKSDEERREKIHKEIAEIRKELKRFTKLMEGLSPEDKKT